MAWTAPRTFVTGEIVTAAIMNTHLRDNLVDLDRRTSPVAASVITLQSTTSTTYTDLATAGPAVTVTIGATGKALVAMHCRQYNGTGGEVSLMALELSGANVVAASDGAQSLTFVSPQAVGDIRHGTSILITGLVSGSTTGTCKYRATNGEAFFESRFLAITPLGS